MSAMMMLAAARIAEIRTLQSGHVPALVMAVPAATWIDQKNLSHCGVLLFYS